MTGAIWFVTGSLATIAAGLGALLQRQVRCSPLFEAFRALPVRDPRPVTEAEMRSLAAAAEMRVAEQQIADAGDLLVQILQAEKRNPR